ncbi:helix-turn-helix domain-containing protein [Lacrimispora saccharolytica]|uniref:Transcriptional regulator, XRE family n=1 Tax=Lacrimispora saccharolytica (strain ATCC 35040 / DSM 2544 / NRCC 2533 / WM1) TaxID=610130 RepID=D9R629_LACSW|nr:helix-turn-helix domain-containing protein [Lacrimispora saccharolytica]ADL03463.1 transcriptional regulator, XRE family [[Clostridium] saccharolyticum WM1]QRV18389.1 helix-turn-helix domain-containing protein [Lacrimispora saccharolytica]
MEIGQIIKRRREELGISQEELALKAGYKSRSSINKIEVDGRGLPQSKIIAIASALKTTPAYLMGWESDNASAFSYVSGCFGEYAGEMLENFQRLNEKGQKEALKRVKEMVHIPEYSKDSSIVKLSDGNNRAYLEPVAAHERTDIKVTEEMKQHDDAFFDE